MNLVDSSGWLEFFADDVNADFFAKPLQDVKKLVVPTISIFEVFKKVLIQKGENSAFEIAAMMQQGTVVDLSSALALSATKISIEYQLSMADSIILATAKSYNATLYTQDSDFENIPDIKFTRKKRT